jgi:anti-anti-sigma factor
MRNEDGALAGVGDRTQAAFANNTPIQPAANEASFAPAVLTSRTHTLVLTGELDGVSAFALEREIERLCEEGVSGITLDLRGLTYIDSTGVAVIAFRCGLCQRRGHDFELVRGSAFIHRAFEAAGVAHLLPFREAEHAPPRLTLVPRRRSREVPSSDRSRV